MAKNCNSFHRFFTCAALSGETLSPPNPLCIRDQSLMNPNIKIFMHPQGYINIFNRDNKECPLYKRVQETVSLDKTTQVKKQKSRPDNWNGLIYFMQA